MDGNKLIREFTALALVFCAALLGVSLATYSPMDPGFNQRLSSGFTVHNQAGIVGAYLAGLLVDLFGIGAAAAPVGAAWGALACFVKRLRPRWWRWIGFGLIFLCLTGWAAHPWAREHVHLQALQGGGLLGRLVHDTAVSYLRALGAGLVLAFVGLVGLQLSLGLSWSTLGKRFRSRLHDQWAKHAERKARKQSAKAAKRSSAGKKEPKTAASKGKNPSKTTPKESPTAAATGQQGAPAAGKRGNSPEAAPQSAPAETRSVSGARHSRQAYPPAELLQPVSESRHAISPQEQEELSQRLSEGLADFNIQGEVRKIMPGPVVTMLEFKPAPGVKVSRIAGLNDDLARALKALAVRIEAPLPGKDTVGIEIPNKNRQTVFFREVVESDAFTRTKAALPLALGKDIQGQPRVEDLTRMPHLLVAGATGAGKSVCLNTILLSLLFKSSPEELKLLLIDPKRIEMAGYAKLPHLVHPVVTDTHLAKNALEWAVSEMESRYDAMARLSVRNIASYNAKLASLGEERPPELADLKPLPYLVIIIDEMADLMLTAGKEVEQSIVRLAQLARAAGVHLILATQRPSVDVVTGLIKANFPTRIAFQVSSKHDSRTILDGVGAEHLLGRGDMLYKGGAGKLQRLHGAFLSDEEISEVIDFWCHKHHPEYEVDLTEWGTSDNGSGGGDNNGAGSDIVDDPMYQQAIDFVAEQGKGSISMLQRRLRVGFNRAARFIEQMERDGILGPQEGSKPRPYIRGGE
ncbi:DNA translocase FtsK [Desulfohalobium retbaense]|uniref:Cell divisionFtsK/SpoIIIE n=1 Tax=Desulfohalobium retbaense (strain ATCC 49708 / DSM 5692 / JCM 16813 / HR100) TaxID=485915 RepID=C8X2E3_DESRD|nr:DNA translocase FtsK [Desulfohalobium retbaense]ACV68590.1 cell divisionFtsK/SpoIIIE [Desulfohalobium retbaense DSM 5692]